MSYKLDYISLGPEEYSRTFFENCINEISYIWGELEPSISKLTNEIKNHDVKPESPDDFASIPDEIGDLVNDLQMYLDNIRSQSISKIRKSEKTIFNQIMLLKEPEIFGNLIYGIMGGEKYNQRYANLSSMYFSFLDYEINLRYPEYYRWESADSSQLNSIKLNIMKDFSLKDRDKKLENINKILDKTKEIESLQQKITRAIEENRTDDAERANKKLESLRKKDVWRQSFKNELDVIYSQSCVHSIQNIANLVRHGIDITQRTIRDNQRREIKDPITGAPSIGGIHIVRNNFTDLLYSVEEVLRIHSISINKS